jgi:NADH-quinone oxidoreductase subunit L
MDLLRSLFPPTNYSLIALVLGMPLLGAFVNGVWGRRLGKEAVRLMALVAVGASFLGSVVAFLTLDSLVKLRPGEHVRLTWTAWEWMHTSGGREASQVSIDLKFSIDALSAVMMLVVTGVGFLIHLYATEYMWKDKGYWRFFAYLNLFIFAMLVLILGDNLPVLFVGWEGVGLCSYLLIGFWYKHTPNASAGKKAFIMNRIGDFGLLCAMFILVWQTGALDWTGIENGAGNLVNPSDSQLIHLWPIGGGQFTGWLSKLQPEKPLVVSAATAAGFLLLLGCTGKSAQIPLYTWLPDAMAGPTPVSALIHAATMVTAGVYLVCRLSFVFALSPLVMMTVAGVGAATAFFAATIALVQNDIKKVLAYSTVSQLGFMFMGVGVGAFSSGFFHVFTHAFFKACLFLGAGSVIHAMHAHIHDDDKAQDIRNMGGLRKYMPLTFWTFGAATLAIIGFPFTSGFLSKDEILFKAFTSYTVNPYADKLSQRKNLTAFDLKFSWVDAAPWFGKALYAVGVAAAVMTAFYMCRLFIKTFFGDFRGWTIGRPSILRQKGLLPPGEDGEHEHEDEHETEHARAHEHEDLGTPGYPPHESPWRMTVPLIVLGTASIVAGFLNAPIVHWAPMDHWLEPVFSKVTHDAVREIAHAHDMVWTLAAGGIGAFVVGTGIAYWMYVAQKGEPAAKLAKAQPGLYKLVSNKWKIDELYDKTAVAAVDALADTAASFDQSVVDGVLARLTSLVVAALGTVLRAFQNGVVHAYAAIMCVGLAALGWFFVSPHADVTVSEEANGDYVVQAAPGIGYQYKWVPDVSTGKTLSEDKFTAQRDVKVHLEPGASQTVRVFVKNAFGMEASRDVPITRPKPDASPQMQLGLN